MKKALDTLNLESLEERRKHLSLKFSIESTTNQIVSILFQKKVLEMILRKAEMFHVNIANTERYTNSAIPLMQRLVN